MTVIGFLSNENHLQFAYAGFSQGACECLDSFSAENSMRLLQAEEIENLEELEKEENVQDWVTENDWLTPVEIPEQNEDEFNVDDHKIEGEQSDDLNEHEKSVDKVIKLELEEKIENTEEDVEDSITLEIEDEEEPLVFEEFEEEEPVILEEYEEEEPVILDAEEINTTV